MRQYSVNFIDPTGHASHPPEMIECVNDDEAVQHARRIIDSNDIEVWDGDRFITRFARVGQTAAETGASQNERPTCSNCGVGMWLDSSSTTPAGESNRTYKCPNCDGLTSAVIRTTLKT